MIRYIVLTLCLVVACRADIPVAPPSPPQVYCGEIPNEVYGCVGIPRFVSVTITRKCKKNTICEKMTCLFEESGWLDGTKVDKTKLSQYFEQFAQEQASWATAIRRAKEACLVEGLHPQGVHLNCPAYDIMTCTFATMLKNAPATQWQTTDKCAYSRQYAGACPVCPGECFAAAVPTGSCNACLALPRTP